MKKNQVKINKINTFALNFKAAPELFNHVKQLELLTDAFKEQLYKKMKKKSYEPLNNKTRIVPCIDLNPDSEKDVYRISAQGIKKREGTKNDT